MILKKLFIIILSVAYINTSLYAMDRLSKKHKAAQVFNKNENENTLEFIKILQTETLELYNQMIEAKKQWESFDFIGSDKIYTFPETEEDEEKVLKVKLKELKNFLYNFAKYLNQKKIPETNFFITYFSIIGDFRKEIIRLITHEKKSLEWIMKRDSQFSEILTEIYIVYAVQFIYILNHFDPEKDEAFFKFLVAINQDELVYCIEMEPKSYKLNRLMHFLSQQRENHILKKEFDDLIENFESLKLKDFNRQEINDWFQYFVNYLNNQVSL